MADVASHTQPKDITQQQNLAPPGITIPPASPLRAAQQHGLTLDTFSPVTQYGSFEFDRIIKQGELLKRTRKTKVRKCYIRRVAHG